MKFVVAVLALSLTGCIHRQPARTIDYVLDVACVKEPIRLEKCDWASPPHCKQIGVVFAKGCERPKVQ